MKQFQFEVKNITSLRNQLEKIKKACETLLPSGVLFEILTQLEDESEVIKITDIIEDIMPDALYYGAQTAGSVSGPELTHDSTLIICTVFEYITTKIDLFQDDITCRNDYEKSKARLNRYCDENEWVKGIEILTTAKTVAECGFSEAPVSVRDSIQLFGGMAVNPHAFENRDCFVFSKGTGFTKRGALYVLYGGEDLNIFSTYVHGWKPLGRKFKVTDAEGPLIKTIDNEPAGNIYRKYLKIEFNEHFLENTIEFPLMIEENGVERLRTPAVMTSDGALVMLADMRKNVGVRLAYGDPNTIIENVNAAAAGIADFCPETIKLFSCVARRLFWGEDLIHRETTVFSEMASSSGFYTHGELLSEDGILQHFNCTIVLCAMREGEINPEFVKPESIGTRLDSKVSFVERLINFIGAASEELEAANKKLAIANAKLEILAKIDSLTGLYNRGEIQKRMDDAVAEKRSGLHLIMLDIDNFKSINDTYGHGEGDKVLTKLGQLMLGALQAAETEHANAQSSKVCVGRWGGEEFMILIEDGTKEETVRLAETIRERFANETFVNKERITLSLGATPLREGEELMDVCRRVDDALYAAKAAGKNRLVWFD